MAREEMRGMKALRLFAVVVIILAITSPGIALGAESTATVEPTSPTVASASPVPNKVPKTAPTISAVESTEPTKTDPPPSEETTETTVTPEPEPYFADEWAELGSGVNSRRWPNAKANPQWVRWTITVSGVPINGGSVHVNFKSIGAKSLEISKDGSYVFETPGHDVLLEARFGALITPGEESSTAPSVKLTAITYGPEPMIAKVEAQDEEPYLPYTESESEPFLPYTGGSEIVLWAALPFGAWGLKLRRLGSH